MNLGDNLIYKFERKFSAKDTYQVKVTTELLEDLANNKSVNEVIININERAGTLTIPIQNNLSKVFNLNIEPITRGEMESLEMNVFRINGTFEPIGHLNVRLNVQATSKVYDMTMKKIVEIEDENKKHCAKELKLACTNKNSLSYKVFQNKETRKSEANLLNSNDKKILPTTFLNKNNQHDLKKTPQFTIREKVLHLLALKPTSKDGILLALRKMDVTATDRAEVEKQINQVSTLNKDNMFQLSTQFLSEIRDDWPYYNDDNKKRIAKLKADVKLRLISQTNSDNKKRMLSSPKSLRHGRQDTISPAESNISSKTTISSNDEGFVSGDRKSPVKIPNNSNPSKRHSQHLTTNSTDVCPRKTIHLSDKNSSRNDLNSGSSCDVTPESDVSQSSNVFRTKDSKLDFSSNNISKPNNGPIIMNNSVADIEGTQVRFNIAFEEYSKLCSKLKEREEEVDKLRSKSKIAKSSDYPKMYKIAKSLLDHLETPQFKGIIDRVKVLESEMCEHVRILTGQQLN